ncbi:MAG: heavy-metal-associated domain-containing protein [Lachnospiraceae bacterium]|nr:heavy-metal-associated domain-containing protein [Lachnospiraceae bacterium]
MYKVTAKIEGMMCTMCESHISETIRKTFPAARKVQSSRKKKEATFLIEEAVDTDVLKKAIEDTGYEFAGASCEPYVKKGLFG